MRDRFMKLAALLGAAAPLFLTGCASTTGPDGQPNAWAPFDTTTTCDRCPNLNGTYSNIGSGTLPPQSGKQPTLSEVFARMGRGTGLFSPSATGHEWPEPFNVTSVTLQQEP